MTYIYYKNLYIYLQLPGGSVGIESTRNEGDAGDAVFIPGSAKSPGGGHGAVLCLVAQWCPTLCDPIAQEAPCPWGFSR